MLSGVVRVDCWDDNLEEEEQCMPALRWSLVLNLIELLSNTEVTKYHLDNKLLLEKGHLGNLN